MILHGLHECLEVRDGRRSIDAVVQVDDVAMPPAGLKTGSGGLDYLVWRAVAEQLFQDIALERNVRIIFSSRCQIMTGAEADDVGAGRCEQG